MNRMAECRIMHHMGQLVKERGGGRERKKKQESATEKRRQEKKHSVVRAVWFYTALTGDTMHSEVPTQIYHNTYKDSLE